MNPQLAKLNEDDISTPSRLKYNNIIVDTCLHELNKIVTDEGRTESTANEVCQRSMYKPFFMNYTQNEVENGLCSNQNSPHNNDYLEPVAEILYDEIYLSEDVIYAQEESIDINCERKRQQDISYNNIIVDNCLHELDKIVTDESRTESTANKVCQQSMCKPFFMNFMQNAVENEFSCNHNSSNNNDYLEPVVEKLNDEIYLNEEISYAQGESIDINCERKRQQDIGRPASHIVVPINNKMWWKIKRQALVFII